MPELPEILKLSRQLDERLYGKQITSVEVLQSKCLNIPVEEFQSALTGALIDHTRSRGKWILTHTSRGWLLLNLGMGGELLLVNRETLPEKIRLIFDFSDGTCLAVNFWWFGYAHFQGEDQLDRHEMVSRIGPNALDVSSQALGQMLAGQRGQIKSFLLDQSHLSGIGNSYVHDILFMARLHPLRKIPTLSQADIQSLWQAIQDGLRPSLEKGGAFYEMDTYGEKGGFTMNDILIGYKEGQPCPVCGTSIQKIKTGGTYSFICPACQL